MSINGTNWIYITRTLEFSCMSNSNTSFWYDFVRTRYSRLHFNRLRTTINSGDIQLFDRILSGPRELHLQLHWA